MFHNGTYIYFSEDELPEYRHLIVWHTISIVIGMIATIMNAVLLFLLLHWKTFRDRHKLYICLAIGDLFNCIGFGYVSVDRRILYVSVVETQQAYAQTSLTCASKAYTWIRLTGSLWPPLIQCAIGVERAACVLFPFFYEKHIARRDERLCIATATLAIIGALIAFPLSFLSSNPEVKFYCDRKSAFSTAYVRFVYYNEAFGYLSGFMLTVIAYRHIRRISSSSRSFVPYLPKIRFALVTAIVSCVLVAVPSIISLVGSMVEVPKWKVKDRAKWTLTTVAVLVISAALYYELRAAE